MTRTRLLLLLALVIPVTLGSSVPGPPPSGVSLVVVLTVDQLRADYLSRWHGQWQGGFRGLLTGGAVFPNGLQDHAVTETAPGHSTILSGRDPAHTGIPANAVGVADSAFAVLGDSAAPGASPNRFVGTTLLDWMRRSDSTTRFLSLSVKDRSAILTIGKSRGPVFWHAGRGFTTSRYYADSLPDWLSAWNARSTVERLAGGQWSLLLADSAYPELDAEPFEDRGEATTFPHWLPRNPSEAARLLPSYPWMDSLTLDLALEGTRALGLGRRPGPDLLAIGLSTTDYIGHLWGPDSREIHDHLLRLDRWLGWFLDSLATMVPRERILLVLTADHGVVSFPEFEKERGRPGGRIRLGALVAEVNQAIARRSGDPAILQQTSGLIYGDTARLRAIGVSPESLATTLAPRVWKLPGVVNAWTPGTLGGASPRDVHAVRWWRTLPRKFAWLVCAVAKPGYIWSDGSGSTDHGTTNPDDVDVPIIFMGPAVPPGLYPDTVRTTDIAPTLARLLRVRPEAKLDGRPIKAIFK
jgi:predicted AlkP superfamily pyrophosphatase or phosphodiesterase